MLDLLAAGLSGGLAGGLLVFLVMQTELNQFWEVAKAADAMTDARIRNLKTYVETMNSTVDTLFTLAERQSEQLRSLETSRRNEPSAN